MSLRYLIRLVSAALLAATLVPAGAFELAGTRAIKLHSRDGQVLSIGTVSFRPADRGSSFVLQLDHARFQDFFLSMREFKCIDSPGEVFCHVPYPYANPRTISAGDLAWLEHALLFFFKTPQDFGAKLWNGVYFRLEQTPGALVGTPQAIDLNAIGAPPENPAVPPYGPAERSEIDPAVRWFNRLTIE